MQLSQMRNLADRVSEQYSKDASVKAVLLFGSVASGEVHPSSDLDIVIIKDTDTPSIERQQYTKHNIEVDLWKHSFSLYDELFTETWQPKEMYQNSMFLDILQNCEILYDSGAVFHRLRDQALNWVWSKNLVKYLQEKKTDAQKYKQTQSFDEFEEQGFAKKMMLLDTCIGLMKIGKPISNRAKDLYQKNIRHLQDNRFAEVFQKPPDHETLQTLIQKTLDMFSEEVPGRAPFTELQDAQKHHKNNEDFMAATSLQNGAYYIGRYGLKNRNIELKTRGFIYPETELELIRKTKKHWHAFYIVYRRVHNIDA